jgi:putative spermidine/putrescine transport system permease protein
VKALSPVSQAERRQSSKELLYKLLGAIIVLPAVLLILTEYVYPFIQSFITSLQVDGQFTWENYSYIFRIYGQDILYTIFVSAASLVVVLVVSIIVGGYLSLNENPFIEFMFKLPLFIPFVVVGHAMRTFLAPKGIVNSLLSLIGLINIDSPPEFAYGPIGTIIALSWKQIAFALLLIMSAFQSVDKSYLEAARNLGASKFRQIREILLPLSFGSIAVSSVLIFTSFLQNFSVVMMMGSGEGARHIMVDIYQQINYLNNMGVANALGSVSYVLALGAAVVYLRKVAR